MKIAILMTVFNRSKVTLKCLKSLYISKNKCDCVFDIFLTDDSSTDSTVKDIKDNFPEVNIIYGDGNLYWNRGMHKAWLFASKNKYDAFLWLNDDVVLNENSLDILINSSKKFENNSIIVGATCDKKGNFTYGGRTFNGNVVTPSNKLLKVDLFNGNIVLIPFSVFKKIGFNDPYYHHDKGDTDYSLMAKKHRVSIYQAPNYIGKCERHLIIPVWMNSKINFVNRLKSFHSITGVNPFELFYFERKHFSVYKAIKKVIFMYCVCLFPNLLKIITSKNNPYKLKL